VPTHVAADVTYNTNYSCIAGNPGVALGCQINIKIDISKQKKDDDNVVLVKTT
jgi:hypothetical protein